MKKFGFTLVEVLMTLGIIGVVGMLVTPSIMENGRNETNAARLSTAVSNFENGIQTGMAADNAEDLYHWDVWTNAVTGEEDTFYGNITRFMALSGHEETDADLINFYNDTPTMMDTDGTRGDNVAANTFDGIYTALTAKNGTMYFIANKIESDAGAANNETAARTNGRTLYSIAANVIIDVNGTTRPNIVGRDIFVFALSNEGTLFPYGSNETANFSGNGTSITGASAADDCNINAEDEGEGKPAGIRVPLTCTARVVESGYRIDY